MSGLNSTGSDQSANLEKVDLPIPLFVGRYRIERILGEGGFGLVYLAIDELLQRPVAIKVPHRNRVSLAQDAEAYLIEARTVAGLDHPHIVPVYDVGSCKGTALLRRLEIYRGQHAG